MTLEALALRLHEAMMLVLASIALWNYAQHRDAVRRDSALIFVSTALAIITYWVFGTTNDTANRLVLSVLLAHPYLLMRMAVHIQPTSQRITRTVWIGSLVFGVGVWLVDLRAPSAVGFWVATGVAFIAFGAVPVLLMLRGAARAAGLARLRRQIIGVGIAFFVVAITTMVTLLFLYELNDRPISTSERLIQAFLAWAYIACFYLGFMPPRWVWHPLQMVELGGFLAQVGQFIITQSLNRTMRYITTGSLRAIGGAKAAVATVRQGTQEVVVSDIQTDQLLQLSPDDIKPILHAWQTHDILYIDRAQPATDHPTLRAKLGVPALYVVPVATEDKAWLVMLLGLDGTGLFPQEDHFILRLFSTQAAAFLENKALIERLRGVNEQLEGKVAERTKALRLSEQELSQRFNQLTAVNRELEAFSYSVSHDLRAPLRAIDGFTRALQEDYGNTLPEDGREYLQRVRAASKRMSRLIDDMLKLSRVSRTDMQVQTVDISAISQRILEELTLLEPSRTIEWVVMPDLIERADSNLVDLMLQNLLTNAWKFTSKCAHSRIEVYAEPQTDPTHPTVFVIRDNGVGFDNKYAEKLFVAFQRLHPDAEFEGTGIGLATVQRVVNRHGGRIWAKGVPNEGAAFYFTLRQPIG